MTRKKYIGEILENMLYMPLEMFIRTDCDEEKWSEEFEKIREILEILGLPCNEDLRFMDIVYQADLALRAKYHWMREEGYQAAELLRIVFMSIICSDPDDSKTWDRVASRYGEDLTRGKRSLDEWMAIAENTHGGRAMMQQDFFDLPLQDFLEYCRTGEQLHEIYCAAGWDMAEWEDGTMEYQALVRDLVSIESVTLVKGKRRLYKLDIKQKKAMACVFFQSLKNLIPEDYVPQQIQIARRPGRYRAEGNTGQKSAKRPNLYA